MTRRTVVKLLSWAPASLTTGARTTWRPGLKNILVAASKKFFSWIIMIMSTIKIVFLHSMIQITHYMRVQKMFKKKKNGKWKKLNRSCFKFLCENNTKIAEKRGFEMTLTLYSKKLFIKKTHSKRPRVKWLFLSS